MSDLEASAERPVVAPNGDRIVAGVLLVFTLPLLLFVSLLIECESPRPIFQARQHMGSVVTAS